MNRLNVENTNMESKSQIVCRFLGLNNRFEKFSRLHKHFSNELYPFSVFLDDRKNYLLISIIIIIIIITEINL